MKDMKKSKTIVTVTGIIFFLFSSGVMSASTESGSVQTKPKTVTTDSKSVQAKPKSATTASKSVQTKPKSAPASSKSVQAKPKSTQSGTKSVQKKSKPAPATSKPGPVNKIKEPGTIIIGTQVWTTINLNVSTFRNGDSIPEAKTNQEWITACESGKPAWCYYNNDPKNGLKYGKLYNWYAVSDPRGLAPAGWELPGDADWAKLTYFLGGQGAAGGKMKSTAGWSEDFNGTNESGFSGLPGGYRTENGAFQKIGAVGTWWSSTESKLLTAVDYYLARSGSLSRSISPKQLGESVRCLRK